MKCVWNKCKIWIKQEKEKGEFSKNDFGFELYIVREGENSTKEINEGDKTKTRNRTNIRCCICYSTFIAFEDIFVELSLVI